MADIRADARRENLEYLQDRHGDIYAAYQEYGRLIHEEGGPLDNKTRWLVKVALTTAGQNPVALGTHIHKAMKSGCSREEIEHAILLTAPSCGFPTMMEGIRVLRDTLDG